MYYVENNQIIFEQKDNNVIYYLREVNNKLLGFKYNNNMYYYMKNPQEDIIGILDSNLNVIVNYEYDSWGKVISVTDGQGNDISSNPTHIGNINPFRYRSYYYDTETGLYYLNSRYYNPEWGRFINQDITTGEVGNILSHNMYQYAFNNPINFDDSDGNWPKWIKNAVKIAVGVAAIAVGVAITVATGGAALPAVVAGVKTALAVATVSAATSAVISVGKSVLKKDDMQKTVKKAASAAVDGFSDGFMTGGIMSGVSLASTLGTSSGIKIGQTSNSNYGKLTIGYGNESGKTIANVANANGKSLLRLDADPTNMLHFHFKSASHGMKYHRTNLTNTIFGVISGGNELFRD